MDVVSGVGPSLCAKVPPVFRVPSSTWFNSNRCGLFFNYFFKSLFLNCFNYIFLREVIKLFFFFCAVFPTCDSSPSFFVLFVFCFEKKNPKKKRESTPSKGERSQFCNDDSPEEQWTRTITGGEGEESVHKHGQFIICGLVFISKYI